MITGGINMKRISATPRVAVVGAAGAVGVQILKLLHERAFPAREVIALATTRSAGRQVRYGNNLLTIQEARGDSLDGVDVAFFAASGDASKQLIPPAVAGGTICIDKSSAFRMDPTVPLVVPEVNPRALRDHSGIIASPNCTTIQLVVALKPIHDAARITRVTVSSYQAVSGSGRDAVDELVGQACRWTDATKTIVPDDGPVEDSLPDVFAAERGKTTAYPWPILGNALPHIDAIGDEGYTGEEWKLVNETRKIMEIPGLKVSATCVRVPVVIGHSLVVHLETERYLCAGKARDILMQAPGVSVCDDPARGLYPMALTAAGQDPVFVGRIREDLSHDHGLILWVVADNLRKGAATNAIQIAETLLDV